LHFGHTATGLFAYNYLKAVGQGFVINLIAENINGVLGLYALKHDYTND
jgi:hypothetical protein